MPQAGTFAGARGPSGWRSDRISNEHHDAPDAGLVAGVDGALGAAAVERAQEPTPVAAGVAHRDQAAIGHGLFGVDLGEHCREYRVG